MSHETDFNKVYFDSVDSLSQYIHFKVNQVEDGEDILQNVYKDYFKYVIQKNKVIDYPIAYLKQMVDKECARYYKHKILKPLSLNEEKSEYIEDEHIQLEIEVLNKITFEEVIKEIQNLSAMDQKILTAYFRFDLSLKEIALQLNASENAVRLRFYRSLKKLREILTQKDMNLSL